MPNLAADSNMALQQSLLDAIRMSVEQRAGRKILSMADANWLASELEQRKLYLSAHTIARFFRILKPERKIYQSSLDLLAAYCGYADWKEYCIKSDDALPAGSDTSGSTIPLFSLYSMEVAIQNKLWSDAVAILDELDPETLSPSAAYSFSEVLTEAVRKYKAPPELMDLLGKSTNGRKLYYEFAVDEDDHDGYFSEALEKFYQPPPSEKGKWFFRDSFLFTKEFYQNRNSVPPPELWVDFNLSELHFHEQSRFLEIRTIELHQNNLLEALFGDITKKAVSLMDDCQPDAKSWIPTRLIMAAFHLGRGQLILQNQPFVSSIKEWVFSSGFQIRHNADLTLQFIFCLAMKCGFIPEETYQPLRLRQGRLWNQKGRIALEYATGLCCSPSRKEPAEFSKYAKFCSENGQQWVLNALQFRNK